VIVSAWRIIKRRQRDSAFTGDGARLYGGRWNSPGTSLVYLAGNASLAALEMLVHLDNHQILDHYLLVEVRFDESLVTDVSPDDLPDNWRDSPPPETTRAVGDSWVRMGTSALLCVPSAIMEHEINYLLNPGHADTGSVEILEPRPFQFDRRLAGVRAERTN
jgi:RES domain-containing protein